MSHRRIHAQDRVDCETKKGDLGEITHDITLEGDVSDDVRQRLIQIADRCLVHNTLTNEIKIKSTLVR